MATPRDEWKGKKIKFIVGPSRARSSGDDDSESTNPPPPPLPRLPLAPPSSPSGRITVIGGKQLALLHPPTSLPADGDSEDVDEDYEDSDEEEEDEELEGSSENDFRCLLMSEQSNTPLYIARHDSEPLKKHEYFSLQAHWHHLLDGKRTYLQTPKGHPVPNDVFLCPLLQPGAITCQEPFSTLIRESAKNSFIQKKIKLLSEQYSHFRRPRRDGSSFYRAFFFSYLENIIQIDDGQAEFTRLMECVATSRDYFLCLKWDKAYFSNPEAYFSSIVSEFKHLVCLASNGSYTADDLYKTNLCETMPSRILSLLRLLTEIEIRAREAQYKPFFTEQKTAIEFCMTEVRPMDVEADNVQIRALSNALGIPLRVEIAGAGSQFGMEQVQCQDFFPRTESAAESTSGPVHLSKSSSSPSKTAQHLEQQRDNDSVEQTSTSTSASLLASDSIPLVTLLSTPGHYDIVYRKQT
ncbi:hypothetical protein QOZ80_4AG0324530 [Eleusine coracana subsp. coracana]|nr:hypothetical protein QOZ80_4AG0324530 [Eleusine coracana subsp. coracana]